MFVSTVLGLKPGDVPKSSSSSHNKKNAPKSLGEGDDIKKLAFQLLSPTPYKLFEGSMYIYIKIRKSIYFQIRIGHVADVVDLSWSPSHTKFGNFLVSASVDKTVRLWLVCG